MDPILLSDFQYDLPDERIARYPLARRDQSKLLVYRQGHIAHSRFDHIADFLPEKSLLVFNNTKVIPARLFFRRATSAAAAEATSVGATSVGATSVGATSVGATSVGGAVIELFLLHPVAPTPIIGLAMQAQQSCTWSCLIGNRKRWKPGEVLRLTLTVAESSTKYILNATLVDQEKSLVHFSWNPVSPQAPNLVCTFADILQAAGQIPLPPYLKRNATDADRQTYQTVYSQKEGAVAAPTAGLHLTDQLLDTLRQRGFGQEYLTLHVGAGTFQPVKTENALDHPMHGEQVVFTRKNIENFRQNIGRIIPVGTTSLRAMESLYWLGVQCGRWAEHPGERAAPIHNFRISQFEPYQTGTLSLPAPEVALAAVLRQMELENVLEIVGETHIMIVPGYQFRLCTGLITNFHQPGSTLLLLIAALLGQPHWRQVYNEALTQNYRFLSYGDASLLLP